MRTKRRYKVLIGLGLLPLLLILSCAAYLKFADLSGYAEDVERILSELLGRSVTIAGRFEPGVGRMTSVVVEQVTLANPEWSDNPAMVQIDRLEGTIDLWSLYSGPIRIRDLRIRGVTIHLEVDAEGRASWDFEPKAQSTPTDSPDAAFPGLLLDDAKLTDVRVTYSSPDREPPLELEIEHLDLHTTTDATIVLELAGLFEGNALTLDGSFGPLDRLVDGGEVEHDLTIGLGDIALKMNGRIGDLATLDDVTLDLDLRGPEIERVAEWLAVPSPGQVPFSVVGDVSTSADGIHLSLDADLGEVTASVRGDVSSLDDPQQMDLAIEAACADLKTVGSWFGEERLPSEALKISGKVRRVDSRFVLESVDVSLPGTTLVLGGILGEPPRMWGTDMTLEASGTDLSVFSEIAEIALPTQAFRADGRVTLGEKGLSFDGFNARLGATELELSGILGDAPRFIGTSLDLRLRAPDSTTLARLSGRDDLPPGPYDVRGRVSVKRDRYVIDGLDATIGPIEIEVDGDVSLDPEFVGTDARVRLAGPDLAELGARAGIADLPAEAFEVDGRVAMLVDAYRLTGVAVRVGTVQATLSGQVGSDPLHQGSDLEFDVRGDDLRALEVHPDIPPLPAEAFSVRGRARSADGALQLDKLEIELGGNRLRVDGSLGPFPELSRTDLQLSLSGPDLAAVASLVPEGLPPGRTLPTESFEVTGHVRVLPDGYELSEIMTRIGELVLHTDGRVGAPPKFHGTDLTFEIEGSDFSWLGELAELDLPSRELHAQGRVEWLESGARTHDIRVAFGPDRLEADGSIGLPPQWIGTNLTLRAEGPSLSRTLALTKRPDLPDQPFLVAGQFDGTPSEFSGNQLELRLGESDIRGSFRAVLSEKPSIQARFTSHKLDLSKRSSEDEALATPDTADPTDPTDDKASDGFLIPDDPIDLHVLQKADIDLVWEIGTFEMRNRRVTDINVTLNLLDGTLKLGPVHATSKWGGTIRAGLLLEPLDDEHRYALDFTGKDWRFDFLGSGIEREKRPPIDIEVRLTGHGKSLREWSRTADGRIVAELGPGRIVTGAAGFVGADILMELVTLLNPFAKSQPYSELECAVVAIRLDDGISKLDPVVMRTDLLTVIGRGAIDLTTEKIHFEWTMKPRKGVGLSASTITNPYVSLVGTLSKPSLGIKPMESVKATGAAVATGGLSLLGRGLWNRVTAGKKVCQKALVDISKDDAKTSSQD